ncbi:MAG: transglutaminase family protein [Pseudomonadota bacterium]
MPLHLSASFAFELENTVDALLQFEAAPLADQHIHEANTSFSVGESIRRISGEDSIGERIWLRGQGLLEVDYSAKVALDRSPVALGQLDTVPMADLPAGAVRYLFDSRYCHPTEFVDFAADQFGAITKGAETVAAIHDWVASNLEYTPGASTAATTATDTFHAGHGICRDFAHLVVTLARACSIPARYVACYAPGVTPQDFHAVAQVYLRDPANGNAGAWHLVDATGMADPAETAIIGVGRDATDVSLATSFGPMRFVSSEIAVSHADSPKNKGKAQALDDDRAALT